MDTFLTFCARILGNELVAAECQALTGGRPDLEGVAPCLTIDAVLQSAYLSYGMRCLAQAATLDDLIAQIAGQPTSTDRFRIEYLRLSPASRLSSRQAILAIANTFQGHPDLDAPQQRYLLAAGAQQIWFGEILTETQHSYRKHDSKPWRTSSSLPSRMSRALVNLVRPAARSILDPFCGTGSLLLEAQALGLAASGMDWNPTMAGMTRRNLEHFGYSAQVACGNALDCTMGADAIVTDLPYGLMLKQIDPQMLRAIFRHLCSLAPQAVYLAEQDISNGLLDAGYAQVTVLRVRKRQALTRFTHFASRRST